MLALSTVRVCPILSESSQGIFTYLYATTCTDPGSSDPYFCLPGPSNDPTLPQLTVAFQVVPPRGDKHFCDLLHPSSEDSEELRGRWNSNSVCILSERTITPDTLSVCAPFRHSNHLSTPPSQFYSYADCMHNINNITYVMTPTVRVVAYDVRSRITINRIPMELPLKIFEANDLCL